MGPLPDFLLPGAMKCGTTSFWQDITSHPDVSQGIAKEVLYFDANYHKGLDWYRAFFHEAPPGEERRHGDASLSYLPSRDAPARAASLLPDVQLIVLLRDPVERAVSHYQHMRRRNEEPLSLKEAVEREAREIERTGAVLFAEPRGGWPRFSYLRRGHYAAQLENWLRFYPRDQILWLRSEDYFSSPAESLARAFAFLGLRAFLPSRFARAGERGDVRDVDPADTAWLRAYFEGPNQELADLTGGEMRWGQ